MLFAHGTNHSKGVLILFNDDLQIDIKNVQVDNNGRYIFVNALVQDAPFLFVNLYAPTKTCEQILFFDQFGNILEDTNLDPNCQVIIGGDFNTHLDPTLDNLGGRIESKPSAKKKSEKYRLQMIWLIFGELEILKRNNLPGLKRNLK